MHVLRYSVTWNQLVYTILGLFARATIVTGALLLFFVLVLLFIFNFPLFLLFIM